MGKEEIKWTLPFNLGESLVEENKIVIPTKNSEFIVLHLPDFETDYSPDDFLHIDYSNIIGELITFSVLMNRIGILRAEYEEIAKNKKFQAQTYEASLKNHYRKKFLESGEKKATVDEINTAVQLDKGYQVVMSNLFKAEKGLEIMNNMFWACKDKSGKLDRIAEKISPKEFEKDIIEGEINGIMVKMKKVKF